MEIVFSLFMLMLGLTQEKSIDTQWEQLTEAIAIVREHAHKAQADDMEDTSIVFDEGIGTEDWIKRDPQIDTAPAIRGLYASAHTANGSPRMEAILQLIEKTDLNAIVIDVKEDEGYVTFETENEKIEQFGTTKRIIHNIDELMNTLEEKEIYPIARIVVFKDKVLARNKPEWSFINPNGTLWANGRNEHFVNPYIKDIWDYNIEVAKEAIHVGFKEIQFDYVRFPEGFEKRAEVLTYKVIDQLNREDVITDFVKYAREQLNPLGARVSVDIFGYAASAPAGGIGQDFNGISKYVDVISPMVYPSHYSTGWFGSEVPDANPYTTIYGAMVDTHKKLEQIAEYKPIVRPWIQDFTATWLKGHIVYGKKEIEEQIRALRDTGVDEFLLWNASNIYTENARYILD